MRRVMMNTVLILGLVAGMALAQVAEQRFGPKPVPQEPSPTRVPSLAETGPRAPATPLRQFDKQPEMVRIQALVVTLSFAEGKGAESTAPSKPGAVADALTRRINAEVGVERAPMSALTKALDAVLEEQAKNASIEALTGLELTTVAGQAALVQIGQRKPKITGVTISQRGRANSVDMENVGTIVQITPQIVPDGSLVLTVDLERSDLGPEAEGIVIATTEDGTEIRSPQVDTMVAKATVATANGQTVAVNDVICSRQPQQKETFLLLRPVVIR